MNRSVLLTITSLLSILLMTFHLSDDIVRGFEPGGIRNVTGVLMLVVWLYGTTVLAGRRSGYIIILLGSILGSGVPVVHMIGKGLVGVAVEHVEHGERSYKAVIITPAEGWIEEEMTGFLEADERAGLVAVALDIRVARLPEQCLGAVLL